MTEGASPSQHAVDKLVAEGRYVEWRKRRAGKIALALATACVVVGLIAMTWGHGALYAVQALLALATLIPLAKALGFHRQSVSLRDEVAHIEASEAPAGDTTQ